MSVAFLLLELQDVASRDASRSADAALIVFKMFFLFMRLGFKTPPTPLFRGEKLGLGLMLEFRVERGDVF